MRATDQGRRGDVSREEQAGLRFHNLPVFGDAGRRSEKQQRAVFSSVLAAWSITRIRRHREFLAVEPRTLSVHPPPTRHHPAFQFLIPITALPE